MQNLLLTEPDWTRKFINCWDIAAIFWPNRSNKFGSFFFCRTYLKIVWIVRQLVISGCIYIMYQATRNMEDSKTGKLCFMKFTRLCLCYGKNHCCLFSVTLCSCWMYVIEYIIHVYNRWHGRCISLSCGAVDSDLIRSFWAVYQICDSAKINVSIYINRIRKFVCLSVGYTLLIKPNSIHMLYLGRSGIYRGRFLSKN